MTPLQKLRHHCTGAIERGESQAIVEIKPETTSAARDAVQPDTLDELFGGGPELPKTYWIDRWARENEQKLALLAALKGMMEWARRCKVANPGPEVAIALRAIAKAERGDA